MQVTKEMQEMMERTMEQYFAAYWQKHATPEQEAKRVREGKTFKGAYEFCKRVADVESSPSTGKVLQCRAKHNKDTDADTKEYAQIVAKKVAAAIKRDKREAA